MQCKIKLNRKEIKIFVEKGKHQLHYCYVMNSNIYIGPIGPMLAIGQNVRLSVRRFTFEVPFKRFFTPISRSRMSNISRASESLGKSSGKKWSQS